MSNEKHGATAVQGDLDCFFGNANGRGLVRIEVQGTGEHVASMPRGKISEATALEICRRWNAHADLLTALQMTLPALEWCQKQWANSPQQGDGLGVLNVVRAVIGEATGSRERATTSTESNTEGETIHGKAK